MKIRVTEIRPPIPITDFDYYAVDDDTYDGPGSKIGRGSTPEAAVTDLLRQITEDK